MRTTHLLQNLEFQEAGPHSQPLYVDEHGRVLLFTLKPGQSIPEHQSAHSPFYVVVLKGQGMFAGADHQEHQFGPEALLIFDPGEVHSIRALDDDLVFVGFLHGAQNVRPGKVGGEIGRSEQAAG